MIKDFSKIATPLTLILKITLLTIVFANRFSIDFNIDSSQLIDDSDSSDGRIKNLWKFKNIKKWAKFTKPDFIQVKIIDNFLKTDFLTFKTRLAFTQLGQAFTKALMFHHFDPKYYIYIKLMYQVMSLVKFSIG